MMPRGDVDFWQRREREQGYPNFKYQIMYRLEDKYKLDYYEAKRYAFSEFIHRRINDDIAWSQHMGPDHFAEVIIEKFINKESE